MLPMPTILLTLLPLLLSFRMALPVPSSSTLQDFSTVQPELVEALLSDSLRLHLVQACQGERLLLQCPRHTHISPLNSFFGRLVPSQELCPSEGVKLGQEDTSCDFAEAHARIQELCRAKRKCRIWVRPELFAERDPCPGTAKYFQMGYKCSPVAFEDQNFCEGQQTRLGCKPGQRLSIYSAHYGRTANGRAMNCGEKGAAGGGGGGRVDRDCVLDVLPQIARRCHAHPWCSFPVDDRFLGSPCASAVPKYLSVIFVCVSEEVFSEAALGGRLEAMEELAKELDALRANGTARELRASSNSALPQRHPLLGENWKELEEEEENGEEGEGQPGMEVGEPEEAEGNRANKQKVPEWSWALLADQRNEALLPWLLLLLLCILALLSICLLWQCRARAMERRQRKLAEQRNLSPKLAAAGLMSLGQQSPAYLDSEGSSQRLLEPFGPGPPGQQFHSNIYHGCYIPGGDGPDSLYAGTVSGGYYSARFERNPMGMEAIRRVPPSLHYYS